MTLWLCFDAAGQPHDIPVLVRGSPDCLIAKSSLQLMRDLAVPEPGLRCPPQNHIYS